MITANIYSLETLPESKRRPIVDGIDMVAGFMGHQITPKFLQVRLKRETDGTIAPKKVGFKNFNKFIDLHVLAVPLVSESIGTKPYKPGFGGYKSGVTFVDINLPYGKDGLRFMSAHETAHAFGFLRPDAFQRQIGDDVHCCRETCIMHRQQNARDSILMVDREGHLINCSPAIDRLGILDTPGPEQASIFDLSTETTDFCQPCATDMRDYGEQNLGQLKVQRVTRAGEGLNLRLID